MPMTFRGYQLTDERKPNGEWKTVARAYGRRAACGIAESREQARQNCIEAVAEKPHAAEWIGQRGGKGRGIFPN